MGAVRMGRNLEGASQRGDRTSGLGRGRPYVVKCGASRGLNELYGAGSAFPVPATGQPQAGRGG